MIVIAAVPDLSLIDYKVELHLLGDFGFVLTDDCPEGDRFLPVKQIGSMRGSDSA